MLYVCFLYQVFLIFPIFNLAIATEDGFCSSDSDTKCNWDSQYDKRPEKLIFYEVNQQEGFNLKRDVYMRFAVMVADFEKRKKLGWKLVLPPWHRLYHWKNEDYYSPARSWSDFFNIKSLNEFAPVVELDDVIEASGKSIFNINRMYILEHFPDAFEGGSFKEKWQLKKKKDCYYMGSFWGYTNITADEIECVMFQGKASKLLELLKLHPKDNTVMFVHGEIALHDEYGTKQFWNARKSMVFNKDLRDIADRYIKTVLKIKDDNKCRYLSIHWRRDDFARGRKTQVPTTQGTATQIEEYIKKTKTNINKIFIATDAPNYEYNTLKNLLNDKGLEVYRYIPSEEVFTMHRDGGIAIIDQIIASQAAHFIGTHESTFTYRIQEEREIMGYSTETTFNRFCPAKGKCEKPSIWKIV